MKHLLLASLFTFLTVPSFASTLRKSCTVELPSWVTSEKGMTMKIRVMEKDNNLHALVSTISKDESSTSIEIVKESEYVIRSGLNAEIIDSEEMQKLNKGEKIIVHAMNLVNDPVMTGAYSAGLELRDVSRVRVYAIGQETEMGMSAIVEAKGANGQDLGSFLGGFLVKPCR